MPARTNDFQELVALIEQALAPKGAKITQSAEVSVNGLETLREVDVLIDGDFGPYRMKVAVEAKDHGRKISVQTFDSLLAKYRGECRVLVDKFVIVSSRGFTEGVIEKAAATDVELLTIEQAKDKEWSTAGPGRMTFRVKPHVCRLEFDPPIRFHKPGKAYREARFYCPKGHDHGSLIQLSLCRFFHKWLPHNVERFKQAEKQICESHNGQGFIHLLWPLRGWSVKHKDRTYKIESVKIGVHIVSQTGTASSQTYRRCSSKGGSRTVHHIKGTAGNKQLEILIPVADGPIAPIRMSPDEMKKLSPEQRKKLLDEKIGQIFTDPIAVRLRTAKR